MGWHSKCALIEAIKPKALELLWQVLTRPVWKQMRLWLDDVTVCRATARTPSSMDTEDFIPIFYSLPTTLMHHSKFRSKGRLKLHLSYTTSREIYFCFWHSRKIITHNNTKRTVGACCWNTTKNSAGFWHVHYLMYVSPGKHNMWGQTESICVLLENHPTPLNTGWQCENIQFE